MEESEILAEMPRAVKGPPPLPPFLPSTTTYANPQAISSNGVSILEYGSND